VNTEFFFETKEKCISKLITSNENIQISVLAYVEFNPQASTR